MTIPTAGGHADAIEVFRRQKLYLSQPHAVMGLWRILTPDQREQLGGNFSEALSRHGTPIYWWAFLNQISLQRAVVELAIKLHSFSIDEAEWLLREMEELPINQEAAQSVAIDRGHLVLICDSRSVFWNGEDCEVKWGTGHVLWDFLVLACEHAKRSEAIDRNSFGYSGYGNIVADRIYKLRQVPGIPQELVDYFEVVGTGTQRFTYPAHRIHIYDR